MCCYNASDFQEKGNSLTPSFSENVFRYKWNSWNQNAQQHALVEEKVSCEVKSLIVDAFVKLQWVGGGTLLRLCKAAFERKTLNMICLRYLSLSQMVGFQHLIISICEAEVIIHFLSSRFHDGKGF